VRSLASHHLYLGHITDVATNTDVDEVFAVSLKSPRTYTREPMAEVYSHGGLAAQRGVLGLMMKHGARLAGPGEFTKRAFLNGRIDLTQAESVLDIIESEDAEELRYALMQAGGMLSGRINAARREILELLAEVEAEIDFPEEEIGMRPGCDRKGRIEALRADISRLVSSYDAGRAIRQGLDVLIVGKTNVGKSSLLNALVERERAIVTPIPGTTRDLVEDTLRVHGVKFVITDTAGLRAPGDADPIEKEGIDRVKKRVPEADIILWVIDASAPYGPEDDEVLRVVRGRRIVAVLNKADLGRAIRDADVAKVAFAAPAPLSVSARAGSGLDELKERLYAVFTEGRPRGPGPVITNMRHRDGLARAESALGRASAVAGAASPIEFLAFELKEALFCLDGLTGEAASDEVLNEIFSRFCIGK
jgi:tRNA modification GTPase